MNNVFIIEHPLVQHKISMLRDKNTSTKEFKELVKETAMLMTYEATKNLPLKEVEIETPVAIAKTKVISGTKLAIIPILRAGLAMADGAYELIPAARIGHIGLFRDDKTKEAVEYYAKFPYDMEQRDVIVVDTMLATANTAIRAIQKIKESGCKSIKFMCIIASAQGMEALTKAFPDIEIYCGVIDNSLTDDLYINPGLGDAGDRIFGTK